MLQTHIFRLTNCTVNLQIFSFLSNCHLFSFWNFHVSMYVFTYSLYFDVVSSKSPDLTSSNETESLTTDSLRGKGEIFQSQSSTQEKFNFIKSHISQIPFRYCPFTFHTHPELLTNSPSFSHFHRQACASRLLGVPQNRIATKVKRVGGAFGGKEWKSVAVALPTVFAAKRLNRPVRIMLDRDEDMVLCGGRHPFYFKYKTAFDDEGKILAHDIVMYNNAGCTRDLSMEVRQTKYGENINLTINFRCWREQCTIVRTVTTYPTYESGVTFAKLTWLRTQHLEDSERLSPCSQLKP